MNDLNKIKVTVHTSDELYGGRMTGKVIHKATINPEWRTANPGLKIRSCHKGWSYRDENIATMDLLRKLNMEPSLIEAGVSIKLGDCKIQEYDYSYDAPFPADPLHDSIWWADHSYPDKYPFDEIERFYRWDLQADRCF